MLTPEDLPMTSPATDAERLADLVASLSGRSEYLARQALDDADPGALAHDPLAAVAAALVALRADTTVGPNAP